MFKDIPQVIRETFWKHLLLSAAIVGFGIIWSVIAGDRIRCSCTYLVYFSRGWDLVKQ